MCEQTSSKPPVADLQDFTFDQIGWRTCKISSGHFGQNQLVEFLDARCSTRMRCVRHLWRRARAGVREAANSPPSLSRACTCTHTHTHTHTHRN
jgi:hypothetical protein